MEYTMEDVYRLPSDWSTLCASKAYILGLKRFAFRREYSSAKLQEVGFTNIEYVDAFDGFLGSNSVESAFQKLGFTFPLQGSSGLLAKAYSHISLWKRMVDESIPYMTIFEDDVLPHKDLAALGVRYWNDTPKSFDIMYLGNAIHPEDPMIKGSSGLVEARLSVVLSPSYSLHAYILSLQGAKRFLALLAKLSETKQPLENLEGQLVRWFQEGNYDGVSWNGTFQQKSYPTYDPGLPWPAFPDIITPQKDTGLVWTNIRLGSTIKGPTIQLHTPPYT
jgi:hypothetical protein